MEPCVTLLAWFIFNEIKNVFVLKCNIKFLQQRQIFVLERTFLMMRFLIADVLNDLVQLRMSIRKCAEAFLLIEMPPNPTFVVDEFGRTRFEVSHQIR